MGGINPWVGHGPTVIFFAILAKFPRLPLGFFFIFLWGIAWCLRLGPGALGATVFFFLLVLVRPRALATVRVSQLTYDRQTHLINLISSRKLDPFEEWLTLSKEARLLAPWRLSMAFSGAVKNHRHASWG